MNQTSESSKLHNSNQEKRQQQLEEEDEEQNTVSNNPLGENNDSIDSSATEPMQINHSSSLSTLDSSTSKSLSSTLTTQLASFPFSSPRDSHSRTPLHLVCEQGKIQLLELLLNFCPHLYDINAKDSHGNTPLHMAVANGHFQVVKRLISHPSIIITILNSESKTPLYFASLYSRFNMKKILCDSLAQQRDFRMSTSAASGPGSVPSVSSVAVTNPSSSLNPIINSGTGNDTIVSDEAPNSPTSMKKQKSSSFLKKSFQNDQEKSPISRDRFGRVTKELESSHSMISFRSDAVSEVEISQFKHLRKRKVPKTAVDEDWPGSMLHLQTHKSLVVLAPYKKSLPPLPERQNHLKLSDIEFRQEEYNSEIDFVKKYVQTRTNTLVDKIILQAEADSKILLWSDAKFVEHGTAILPPGALTSVPLSAAMVVDFDEESFPKSSLGVPSAKKGKQSSNTVKSIGSGGSFLFSKKPRPNLSTSSLPAVADTPSSQTSNTDNADSTTDSTTDSPLDANSSTSTSSSASTSKIHLETTESERASLIPNRPSDYSDDSDDDDESQFIGEETPIIPPRTEKVASFTAVATENSEDEDDDFLESQDVDEDSSLHSDEDPPTPPQRRESITLPPPTPERQPASFQQQGDENDAEDDSPLSLFPDHF